MTNSSSPESDLPDANDQRPTRVRDVIVFVTVVMSVILYLDRYCVSFSERYIKEDLKLSEFQMATFLSSFFLAYALAQVPAGWLSDRFGCRGVLAFYIVSWSVFTALIGLAGGAVMLITMRFACGLAQAGAYPSAGALLSRWVPFSRRGFASGLVALGGRLGAVIAPILTAYLMVVFVPLSVSADLAERDILNGVALCGRLAPPSEFDRQASETRPEYRLKDLLPDDAQAAVDRYGRLQRAYAKDVKAIEADARRQSKDAADSAAPPANLTNDEIRRQIAESRLGPDELKSLCVGLNSLLHRPDLFSDADFATLKNVESEALGLFKRRQRGEPLSENEPLSEYETVRFNRLVLEALFPAEIGKLYVKGWRPVLYVYGMAGVVVAGIFWFFFRNSPAEHPRCNRAEQELIAGNGAAAVAQPQSGGRRFPARAILRSTSLWLSSISQFATNVAWVFFVIYLPRYLMDFYQVPILERSWMVSIPSVAGIVGMLLGGHLTDRLTRRVGVRWGRALPMALTRFFAAAAYLACLWIHSPWMATAAFAIGYFFVDLGVSATWAFMQDVGGKYVGAILGWGNMWGNIGAFVAPYLYNAWLGPAPSGREWNLMFVYCAAMFVVSGVSALGINATVPVTQADPA